MLLQVTGLYTGLTCLIGLVLAGLVGRARGAANVSLNDGGNPALIEAIRRHMNWVEYVPFILILFAIYEANGGSKTWLHVMGIVLVLARLVHPFGLHTDKMFVWQRGAGAGGTIFVAIAAIISVLWQSIGAGLHLAP